MSPDVAVVVTHYDQPRSLALVLAALGVQTLPSDRFEVVVADDGSPVPPVVGEQPYRVGVVTQADRGFRAAAARNRGVRATSGRLLCFLDADTIPEPGYLAAVLAEAERTPDCVVAGRRRHADLQGWDTPQLLAWFGGRRPGPAELEEPGWLRDGFRWTDDLRDADDESYRYVIGATFSVHRDLLERAGGWDERFVGYGGEDWEVVNRCWLAGARMRHVREAVAWHDGPDFAGRPVDRVAVQNAQALALARLLPSEATRPPGPVWQYPEVVVEVDDRGWDDEQALLCVASLLAGTDAGVWLREGHVARSDGPLAHDPRVHVGPVPTDVRRRCRATAQVDRPLEVAEPLRVLLRRGPVDRAGLRLRPVRRPAPCERDARTVVDRRGVVHPPDGTERRSTRDVGTGLPLGSVLRERSETARRDLHGPS